MPTIPGVPTGRIVLVTTPTGFGFGLNKEQAVKSLPLAAGRRQKRQHTFYHCDPSTYVTPDGRICWDNGLAPEALD